MKVDMSSKAVTVRLKRVSQMRRLCVDLGKARAVRDQAKGSTPQEEMESSGSETDEVIPTPGQES